MGSAVAAANLTTDRRATGCGGAVAWGLVVRGEAKGAGWVGAAWVWDSRGLNSGGF